MGIFDRKRRSGSFTGNTNKKQSYTWSLPNFLSYTTNTTLDSDIVKHRNAKFHLHLVIDAKGNIGLYMHYKTTPVPKYTYNFENAYGEVMRQHTAYSISPRTERCGHWSASTMTEMKGFLSKEGRADNVSLPPAGTASSAKSGKKTTPGTLLIRLTFDYDHIETSYQGEFATITWFIPRFRTQMVNPFTSKGFCIKDKEIALRVDTTHEAKTITRYDLNHISEYIFFVFSHLSTIPEHTIAVLTRSEYDKEREMKLKRGSAASRTNASQNSINEENNTVSASAIDARSTQATNGEGNDAPNTCPSFISAAAAAPSNDAAMVDSCSATQLALKSQKLHIIPRERISDYLVGDPDKETLVVRASFRVANNPLDELNKLTSINLEERETVKPQMTEVSEKRHIYDLVMDI